MHFEDKKVNSYSVRKVHVSVVQSHKDLEVTVSHDLKITAHYQ